VRRITVSEEEQQVGTKVVIEARDLDTDERERVELDVDAPSEEHAQRTQLKELVAAHHPGARLRSFADGAASFLGRQHLVVATYDPKPRGRRPSTDASQQEGLFAA